MKKAVVYVCWSKGYDGTFQGYLKKENQIVFKHRVQAEEWVSRMKENEFTGVPREQRDYVDVGYDELEIIS